MNQELLTIQVLGVDGVSYQPMLVDGVPVELVDYSYVSSRMGTTSLSCSLRHLRCLDDVWTGREFVEFRGVRMVLDHRPGSSKSNEDERYVHALEFRAVRDVLLSGVYFCDAVSSGAASAGKPLSNSYDVKFFGTLDEFVQRFSDVLSYLGLSSRFSVSLESGVVGTTESKEISFSNATLFEALTQAVEVWEVPFYFAGDSAVFGSADSAPLVGVEYGHDRELLSVSMNARGEKVVTRISGHGGSENVPYYYPNPSPKGLLGVGGTAAGVTVRSQVDFAQKVGLGDVLTYMGRSAVFGSAKFVFGGKSATSVSAGVSAVVRDVALTSGVSYPFSVELTGDVSGGFSGGVDVGLTPNVGNTQQVPGATDLYYVRSYDPYGSWGGQDYDYVVRPGSEVAAKGWDVVVDRVEVVAGGVVREAEWEERYAGDVVSGEDRGLYAERRVSGVRVDLQGALSQMPAGTSLTSCVVRVVGHVCSHVLWQVNTGSGFAPAGFWSEQFSASPLFEPSGWFLGDWSIGDDLSVVGLSQSGSPVAGSTITQVVLSYVTPTGVLMPGIYRSSGGAERAYDALNGTYIDPETGDYYTFEHEYDPLEPHEHVEDFEDIVPSIRNLKDGQGNALNVVTDVWFDDGFNTRDVLDDGVTLKYQWFFVKLKALGFNLFDCAIEDGEMALVMSDGPCAGCHFKLLVTSTGGNPVQKNQNGTLKKEGGFGVIDAGNLQESQQDTTGNNVWVALYLDSSTFGGTEVAHGVMPDYDKASDAGPRPVSGNAYTLENILLPEEFFLAAERELDAQLVKFMHEHNADKFDPSVVFSRVYLAQNPSVRAGLSERSRLSLTYDGKTYSPLYVSQFTMNVKEGEALPEILVETSDIVEAKGNGLDDRIDTAVSAALNVVRGQLATDARETDGRYLRKDADDSASGKIVFEKGLEVGGYQPGRSGIGGTIYTNAAGEAIAEVDFLTVRRKATFTQVEVDALRKVSGTILLSLAEMEVSAVEEVDGGWKCWFKSDTADGKALENGFVAGDQAICQTFLNNDTHYYWRLVTDAGPDWIVLSESDCAAGSDAPEVGDVVVQLGNRSDASRQAAQMLSCYGEDSPSYVIYAGISSYTLAGKDISGFVYRETSAGSGVYEPYFFNYGPMLLGDRNKTREYVEFNDGALTLKGTFIVKTGESSYQSMTDYMSGVSAAMQGLQDQIDGNIQSWSSGGAQSAQTKPYPLWDEETQQVVGTANYPASGWSSEADREKHFGDIYVDDSTGQGYRYTKRTVGGVTQYYWTKITDEEVAEALRLAQQANTAVAGLNYLKEATNNGTTLVDGGLILSNIIALGKTENEQFRVWAGINGIRDTSETGNGIAAWFGGELLEKAAWDAMTAAQKAQHTYNGVGTYAKTLFRMDGTGYLASGNITWNADGSGSVAGGNLSWDANGVPTIAGGITISGSGGATIADLLAAMYFENPTGSELVQLKSAYKYLGARKGVTFVAVGTNETSTADLYVKTVNGQPVLWSPLPIVSESFISAGGISSGGGSEGATLTEVWDSLSGNSGYGANRKINTAHLPLATVNSAGAVIVGSGLSVTDGVLSATNAGTITSVTKNDTAVAGGNVTTTNGAVSIQFPIVPTKVSDLTNDANYISSYTDEKVAQTNTTTSSAYRVLLSYTADNTTRTEGARKSGNLTFNPSTKALSTNGGTVDGLKLTAASTGFTIAGGTTSRTLTVNTTYTLGDACAKGYTDSSSASAIGTGTSLVTERDVYYGLPTINNAHNYTSSTNIYAPTSGGSNGQVLTAQGTTSAPGWTDQSSLSVGTAAKLSVVSKTAWGRTYWTANGVPDNVSGDMTDVGKMTFTAKTSKSTSGNVLEVVTISGVTYLHSVLPIVSDSFISAGGLSDGGGTAGGNAILQAQTYGGTLSATGISAINFYSKERVDELIRTAGDSLWERGNGTNSVRVLGNLGTADGNYSTVEGKGCITGGEYTELPANGDEGDTTHGSYGHAEGRYTIACGFAGSHAEGNRTLASGNMSHAENNQNIASGASSHAEGYRNIAEGGSSHVEGEASLSLATSSHAETAFSNAVGNYSHAELGNNFVHVSVTGAANATSYTVSCSDMDMVSQYNTLGSTIFQDVLSKARICKTGDAVRTITRITQINSIAVQNNTLVISLVMEKTLSSTALSNDSTYRLNYTMSYGTTSHSESSTSYGGFSHAEGSYSFAAGEASHAEGTFTVTKNNSEHAEGRNNVSNKASDTYGNAGNTQHSIGIGTGSNRKNAVEVMQNGDFYMYGVGGYDGTNFSTADTVQEALNAAGSAEQITYANLKSLRDSGGLVPGRFYRVTDFTTTTTNAESRAVGHLFDIVILAIDERHLSEECYAAHHAGDTYFANSRLEAWKLWYDLENDTSKYNWADTVNGKGVIFRMIDEYKNDLPYDFKNIQFKRYRISDIDIKENGVVNPAASPYIGIYAGLSVTTNKFIVDSTDYKWFYSFTFLGSTWSADIADASIGTDVLCSDNYMSTYGSSNGAVSLNNVVFARGAVLAPTVIDTYDARAAIVNCKFGQNCGQLSLFGYSGNNDIGNQFYGMIVLGRFRMNNIGHYFMYSEICARDFSYNDIAYLYKSTIITKIASDLGDFVSNKAHNADLQYLVIIAKQFSYNDFQGTCRYLTAITTDGTLIGNRIGIMFYVTIRGMFRYVLNAGYIINCSFGSVNHCQFFGYLEYVYAETGTITTPFEEIMVKGTIRGASGAPVRLENSNFLQNNSTTTIGRSIVIEANNDGKIIASWRASDGEMQSIYATAAETRSNTWHTGGYFTNGVLPYNHGGTGQSTYAKGDLLYASAANTLSKLAANTSSSKRFLTMTSSTPSWGTIASGDLPAMYIGRTQVIYSAANTNLLGVNAISNASSIGSSDKSQIVWDSTNNAWHFYGNVYADGFISAGGLSSGGGGGGGATALSQLTDVQLTSLSNGQMLKWNGSKWVNVAAPAGSIVSVSKGTATSGGAVTTTNGAVTIQFPTIPTSLPASNVSFGTQATDYIPLTISNTTKNVLTAHQSLSGYVPTSRTVNSKALSSNITLTLDDIGNGTNRTLASYLPLAGGTMTGVLHVKGSMYSDAYDGALDMANSDIYNLNSIYTADLSDSQAEGIHFYRTTTTVDTFRAKNGVLYFAPNRTLGGTATEYTIIHTGNYSSYTPILNSSGTHATSSSVIYAPTTVGTSGYVLTSSGSGAPGWTAQSSIAAGSATKDGSGNTITATYVSAVAINGNYLRVTKNGSNSDLTIGYATQSGRVTGSYTSNGGQQNPNYFGTNKVGFLMMNTTVNGNSQYKDWVIMDCYSGSDVGGGVAIGVNRQALGAYIMRSAAARTSWAESAELIGTHNYTTYTVKKDGTGASGTWGISVTGNAGTATKLATARTIWGQSFDGSGNVNGLIAITANSNTVTIGSQNSSWCHIYNSANIDFIFNHSVYTTGKLMPYQSAYDIGSSSSRWGTVYSTNLNSSGAATLSGGVSTTTVTASSTISATGLYLNRSAAAANGRISFYSSSYVTWIEYMTNAGSASPTGANAQSGTYVTSWALRSLIENNSGYGWTWESCANSSNATPAIKMELSSNTGNLHIVGSFVADGAITAGAASSSSDARLKSNIMDFRYSSALLMALKPREWDWNRNSNLTGHSAGVVAQEIQGVMPYAVGSVPDDRLGSHLTMNYDTLHAVEIAGLQDLEARVRALEEENRELRKRLNMN